MRILKNTEAMYRFLVLVIVYWTIFNQATEVNANGSDPTLKLVQVLFRHGDRAPTNTYPKDSYWNNGTIWPEGMAQLTSIGKMQQYQLGQFLRKRYNKFMGPKYNREELFVVSSDMDRTIMSLESNLAGLYPPMKKWNPTLAWQPIPLRTIPRKVDSYLHSDARCPKFDRIHRDFLQNSDVITQLNEEHRDFIKFLAEQSGLTKATTVKEILVLQDILLVQSIHNLTIPKWGKEALPLLNSLQAQENTWSTYTDEMKRLKGGPLLKLLTHNMLTKAEKFNLLTSSYEDSSVSVGKAGRKSKMLMFSAHDATLCRIMNTMGIFQPHLPPYAAALIIELHSNGSSLEDHYVEIYYRNDTTTSPYQLQTPGCSIPCKLTEFIKLNEHLIPSDWAKECQDDTSLFNSRPLMSMTPTFYPTSVSTTQPQPDKHFCFTFHDGLNYFWMLFILLTALIVVVWFSFQIANYVSGNGRFLRYGSRPAYERI